MAKPELEYSTISIHTYSVGWNQASSPMLRPTELGAFVLRTDGYQVLEASFFVYSIYESDMPICGSFPWIVAVNPNYNARLQRQLQNAVGNLWCTHLS